MESLGVVTAWPPAAAVSLDCFLTGFAPHKVSAAPPWR